MATKGRKKNFSNQSFAEMQQFVPCMEKSTHLEERERQMCLVSFSGRPSRTIDCCRGRETKWVSRLIKSIHLI